jgi:L-glyceraldehyde 3-phosphate reductase
MALSWLLKDDGVCSVIIGASSVDQLNKNLRALENTSFSEKERIAIDDILNE